MVRVLLSEQGSLDDLRRTLEDMRTQCIAARTLFAGHAAYIAQTGGTFPERRHLLAMANRFMIGQYDHIIDGATWALEHIETWPDATTPAGDDEQVREMLQAGLDALPVGAPATGLLR
jgi:hypothetical protein